MGSREELNKMSSESTIPSQVADSLRQLHKSGCHEHDQDQTLLNGECLQSNHIEAYLLSICQVLEDNHVEVKSPIQSELFNGQYTKVSEFLDSLLIPLVELVVSNKLEERIKHVALRLFQIIAITDSRLLNHILLTCGQALQNYSVDSNHSFIKSKNYCHHAHALLQVISIFLTKTQIMLENDVSLLDNKLGLDSLLSEAVKSLLIEDDNFVGKVLGQVLPVLLQIYLTHGRSDKLEDIWKAVFAIHIKYGMNGCTENGATSGLLSSRPFMVLCGLANNFFPVDGFPSTVHNILTKYAFWSLLQTGFFHTSPITRKRSSYLLKRIIDIIQSQHAEILSEEDASEGCLFWWNDSKKQILANIWEDYILLAETLEEKQVHVIKPLMARFAKLVEAASEKDSRSLLHTSWLSVLFQRCAMHESQHVQRWAVEQLLQIDLVVCPMFKQRQSEFLCGPFITMLNSSTIYHKPTDVGLGQCPPIANKLNVFFQKCSAALTTTDAGEFFTRFVTALSKQHWNGSVLVFVVRALASVPSRPLLNVEGIGNIRWLLTSCVNTMDVHVRAAIQCYVVKTTMNLIDTHEVSPTMFLQLVATLKRAETIQRGTCLWQDLTHWLAAVSARGQHWTTRALVDHCKNSVTSFFNIKYGANGEAEAVSEPALLQSCTQTVRLLLLLVDSGQLMEGRSPDDTLQRPVMEVLCPLIDILTTINTHAYMSSQMADRAFLMLNTLIHEVKAIKDGEPDKMSGLVLGITKLCVPDIILFVQRRVMEVSEMEDIASVRIYCETLEVISYATWSCLHQAPNMESLITACTQSVAEGQQHFTKPTLHSQVKAYGGMSVMATLSGALLRHDEKNWYRVWVRVLMDFLRSWDIVQSFLKPRCLDAAGEGLAAWGPVASSFLDAQWKCIFYCMVNLTSGGRSLEVLDNTDYLEQALLALDPVCGEDVIPVVCTFTVLIPRLPADRLVHVLQMCWRKVKEQVQSGYFWEAYLHFLDLAFSPSALKLGSPSKMHAFHESLFEELFSLGEEKQGVVNAVVYHLCQWAEVDADNMALATAYVPVFVRALLFGPIHCRGRRFRYEVLQLLTNEGEELSSNQLLPRDTRDDVMVRVQVLCLLVRLRCDAPEPRMFARALVAALIDKHEDLVRRTSYRNYCNSLCHRQKHRLVSALVFLQKFLDEDSCFKYLMSMLMEENQPSVRFCVEWLMILLLQRNQHLVEELWLRLNQGSDKKPANLCSLLTVVGHLAKLLDDIDTQVRFMDRALVHVMPWCMSHHFNLRTFAQATLHTLWSLCEENSLDHILTKHSIVGAMVAFSKNNKSAAKNSSRLMDNFLYKFHPVKDYSIETVLYTLPRLNSLIDEEWISPSRFSLLESSIGRRLSAGGDSQLPTNIPLLNRSQELKTCPTGAWRVRVHHPDYDEDDELLVGDVQKKMIPWRHMIPETELGLELQDDYVKKRHRAGGLVLVTSLINKVPNLGGLCRTAEIFGVSEFVIGSLHYMQDRAFESVSVSAQKWIPIKEVRPEHLKVYMEEMRGLGYTLVGAEQTNNSSCLTEYQFPRKTMVLLGNEKEGIPVELIQMLDVCVEIPQQGIIRSLNVHVSGALLVWEYARQQLLHEQTPS